MKELIYGSLKPKEITIYTLNDENSIEYMVRSLKNQYPETAITIQDGGSEDKTLEIADRLGVKMKQ
ncbi:MAG: glycosyltransferase [bacterium]|nr:glycosyltransferase [bacterium]